MKALINELLPLTKRLSADWETFFLTYNIASDVQPLYDRYPRQTANTIVAYIILSYFQTSSWFRHNQDRLENKISVMTSLLKTKWPVEEPYKSVVDNANATANVVIEWALRFQQDWRIAQMEAYRWHQATTRMLGTKQDSIDPAYLTSVGKTMQEGQKIRELADDLQKAFDNDFAPLNSALSAEGRSKLSEIPSNQITWEQHIAILNQQKADNETI